MRRAEISEQTKITEWLKSDIANCLYMYMDIVNYGLESPNMDVYIYDRGTDYIAAAMRYYDSFQLFINADGVSKDERDAIFEGFAELITTGNVSMASGRKEIIEGLSNKLPGYKASYGLIHKIDRYRKMPDDITIVRATPDDTDKIAELICSDPEIGSHYTVKGLSEQLSERIKTNTGRSYLILDGDKVVAHTATYAETADYAVTGGTIIAEPYRIKNYYIYISNHLLQELIEENKEIYTFSINESMKKFHDVVHKRCAEYGKLERIV